MSYRYPLLRPLITTPDIGLASVLDIGCMKLSAIISRSTLKDYVDLYFIFGNIPLHDLLTALGSKFPSLDPNVVLKALVYFDDIQDDPIIFQPNFAVDRASIEDFIVDQVRQAALPNTSPKT